MADVFISYAREDREAATKLAHALENQGYSVWWDPVIPPGKTWAEVIGTQLGMAGCVVALWSTVSVTKKWVSKEAAFADERNKLIPAKLENVTIPFAFADIQAADLTGWQGNTSHEGFQHLVSAISELLRNPPTEQIDEDIVVATEQAKAQLAESQATQDRPASTETKTEKRPIKAAWERFRAHVRLPVRQTLLNKRAIIIGGVSIALLVSLLLLIPPKPSGVIGRGPVPAPGITHTPEQNGVSDGTVKPAPAPSSKDEVPDWVPVYPFADQENVFLRRGAGAISFETENGAQHVSEAYAAKLKAAGWKVGTSWRGGGLYSTAGTSPEKQRSVAVAANSAEDKTHVAVSFLDSSVVQSEELFSPESVPSWIPVYPGRVENLRYKGNSGGFSITTTDAAKQVSLLYEAILGASGYEVVAGWSGGAKYNVQGTAKSQGRSIAASTDADNKETKVLVLFEQQQKPPVP